MRLKYVLYLLLLMIFSSFASQTVMVGFKDSDPRTAFVTRAMLKYLRANLEEAGFEIMDDKVEGLELNMLKHGNFFLASREYFEKFENINLDNSITGVLTYRGRNFTLMVEIFSREKRRLVLKTELKGSVQNLLAFFHHLTRETLRSLDSDYEPKNVFPVDDESFFYRYIRYAHEADLLFQSDDPDRYYALLDELEAMKGHFERFPAFAEIHEELIMLTEDYEKTGPFELPVENVSLSENPRDNEIQRFARGLIVDGYQFFYRSYNRRPIQDKPDLTDLTVEFDIKLKRSSYNAIMAEIKKRNGSTTFINMGRYFLSENDRESATFRDFLLNQTVELRFIDGDGKIISSAEAYINKRQYSNGAYRNADVLPMPLTPRAPAYPAFGLKSSAGITFEFKNFRLSDISRAVRCEILIRFE